MVARRTKIVATLGPATDDPGVLEQLVAADVNVFRLNFSHGSKEDHIRRATQLRELANRKNTWVALLGDLQGPKIRIQSFAASSVPLQVGQTFALDAALGSHAGNENEVGIDYKELPNFCQAGDTLVLDDGRISLRVNDVTATRVECSVVMPGILSNKKGINRLGGGLAAPALTEKDFADMHTAAEIGVDYIAVSFPSRPEEVEQARKHMRSLHSAAYVVAKIERAEAVASEAILDEIIRAADAIMVARGDLGVEIGDAELIGIQKYMIRRARQLNRCVITATQMMESMIASPLPTRAEVFDVANAVLDGTDAVMLSAETAAGEHPLAAVQAMARTCIGAERQPSIRRSSYRMDHQFERVDEAIAMSTMFAANHLEGVAAIVCLTRSGATPLWLSRLSSGLPIYAFCHFALVRRRVALFRGVTPIPFDSESFSREQLYPAVLAELQRLELVTAGDYVLVTRGPIMGEQTGTDCLKILTVK